MNQVLRLAIAGMLPLGLLACGGGSDSPDPGPSIELAKIDAGNATVIASAVVKASYQGGDIGNFVELPAIGGSSTTTKTGTVYAKVGEVQVAQTGAMLKDSQIGTFQAPLTPVEQACDVGGYVVLSGDIQNPEALGVNDVLTMDFVDCDDGFSLVDGRISMTILAFSGDFVGDSFSFSVAVELDAFAVTEDGLTETADGDITMSLNLPSAGPITMSIEASDLTVSDSTGSSSLHDFSLTQSIDPVTSTYTMSVSGLVGSSAFTGMVEFQTSIALTGDGDDFAASGELIITGAGDSTIAIFALDGDLVRLEIDYDGDGIVDEVVDTTWSVLISS